MCPKSNTALKKYSNVVVILENLFKVTQHLMGETTDVVLPSGKPANVLVQDFSHFFIDKVECIRSDIAKTKVSPTDRQCCP